MQVSGTLVQCLALDLDVSVMDVSRDGSLVATCSGRTCFVWHSVSFSVHSQLNHRGPHVHKLDIRVCRFDPDTRFLLTAGDDLSIVIWSLQSKKAVRCAALCASSHAETATRAA